MAFQRAYYLNSFKLSLSSFSFSFYFPSGMELYVCVYLYIFKDEKYNFLTKNSAECKLVSETSPFSHPLKYQLKM